MEFIKILQQRSKGFYASLLLLSLINALLNTGLLLFINGVITNTPLPYFPQYDWLLFCLVIVASLTAGKIFQTYIIRLNNDIHFDFTLNILTKLKHCSFESFEKLGNEKVFTAMGDIQVLSHLPEVFMNAFNAIIVITCCISYLFWVSPVGGFAVLGIITMLLTVYIVRNVSVEKDLNTVRSLQNSFFQYLNDLLHGFKEVKMSIRRNNNIHSGFLMKNRQQGKDLLVKTSIKYMNNELTGSYSWYVVLGVVIFVLPRVIRVDLQETTAFIISILYLMGPVAIIVTLIPTYTNVKIAVNRLTEFNRIVESRIQEHEKRNNTQHQDETAVPFSNLRFKDIIYDYIDRENEKTFGLGPINLEIQKGEVIFVTGANGSGKSTFVNLVTGLYQPTSGEIFYNDCAVSKLSYAQYSNQVSAIFTSNYLFSENYDGFDLSTSNKKLTDYITLMKLDGIVRIHGDENTLSSKLSKGQQKRLAMIYALLDEKEILVLDEWAAEQDPYFRKYFYASLIPAIRSMGKTLIVITHDDTYYPYADRLIKFDYGQIVSDTRMEKVTEDQTESVYVTA